MRRIMSPLRFTMALGLAAGIAGCSFFGQSAPAPARHPADARHPRTASVLWRGTPTRVLPGDLLIADSYNNRIIIVNPHKQIIWQFPKPGTRPNLPFNRPDDGFFGPHFNEVITNEEDFDTIAIINFRTERIVWQYGHRSATGGVPGSAPGYLDTPDDAFLLDPGGHQIVTVADIRNQRILFIDRATKRILKQYGETGVQVVNPPTTWGAPNGDFPAPNGGMLVTQINGQDAVLLNRQGRVVWTVHFPYAYPSDANFTPNGNIICAFYDNPGAVVIMSPSGQLLWQYAVPSGPGALNHPSLAIQLPNGMIALNDDYNDRVIIIDPKTKRIVWQYGHTGVPGSGPGYLNIPDGMDFLPAGVIPGNPANPIGHHLWSYPGNGY
jgi:outer membrane protein assembly factor BamB